MVKLDLLVFGLILIGINCEAEPLDLRYQAEPSNEEKRGNEEI